MSGLPTFSVRNLGPIREATVQLHPLTILIGRNNTGKTYMAKSIYAAYKALEGANGPAEPLMDADESEDFLSRLYPEAEQTTDLLRGSLRAKTEGWMRSRTRQTGTLLRRQLPSYFDVDDPEELRRWQAREPVDVSVRTDNDSLLFGLRSDSSSGSLPAVTLRDLQEWPASYSIVRFAGEMLEDGDLDNGRSRGRVWLTRRLAGSLWEDHFLPSVGLGGTAYYLPAGRSGLLEAWTDVVRLRLRQERDGLALRGREPAALGSIALDFLDELLRLFGLGSRPPFSMRRRGGRSKQVRVAATHLEELIEGDVEVTRGRERIPSFAYTQNGNSIPIQRASSMVAELAPLLGWIKDVLDPGDLILIDEPEAHLHPEGVLAVAQTLVALSRAGVKVLCTTHSSDFLHQVSNSMLRSVSTDDALRDQATSINVADIGVYRFERIHGSSATQGTPVEIDPGWGIPEDEHVAVAERLSRETAELVESLR